MPRSLLRQDAVGRLLAGMDLQGKSLLEFGYGMGEMLGFFARLGMEVSGHDFSEGASEYAADNLARKGLTDGVTLLQEAPNTNGPTYDYIAAFEVLEHIEQDEQVLRQWADLLDDRGRVLLSFPAHRRRWSISDEAAGHFRRYDRQDARRLLGVAGLRPRKIWNYGGPTTMLLDPLQRRAMAKALRRWRGSKDLEERTKASGLHRGRAYHLLDRHRWLMAPMCWTQRLFFERDWSPAMLVLAEKA